MKTGTNRSKSGAQDGAKTRAKANSNSNTASRSATQTLSGADAPAGACAHPQPRPKNSKTPRDSRFVTRKIVAPDQLNPNETLFGGVMMSWIDEVAFMTARRYSGRPFVVTASIDNITFAMPLKLGEHVVLTSQVNYVGRSSMEIGVKVERENPYNGERAQATSAYLTFVALDKKGRPCEVPRLVLETDEDRRRYEDARLRVKVRERVRGYLKKKYEKADQRGTTEGVRDVAAQQLRLLRSFKRRMAELPKFFSEFF